MKFVFLSVALFSTMSFAQEVVFLQSNEMPEALKNKVSQALIAQCPAAFEISSEMFEEETLVRVERIDQGVIDYYFTSTFTVTPQNDTAHRESYAILVNSSQMAGTNPTPDAYGNVDKIESVDGLCK